MPIYKKVATGFGILVVLFASVLVFPWLSFILGWSHGPGVGNLVTTVIFIFMWLFVLLWAKKGQSNVVLRIYIGYWALGVVAHFLLFFIWRFDIWETFGLILFLLFSLPTIGAYHFHTNPGTASPFVSFLVALCLLAGGLWVKNRKKGV